MPLTYVDMISLVCLFVCLFSPEEVPMLNVSYKPQKISPKSKVGTCMP